MASTQTLIILGAAGDLTTRLLVPGLAGVLAREPDRRLELIGVGHSDSDDAAWRESVRGALEEGLDALGDLPDSEDAREAIERTVAAARWRTADATDREALRDLMAAAEHPPILYFALPPHVTVQAIEALQPGDIREGVRVAVEKPFGHDTDSARHLNGLLAERVREDQIFRVDHFLGKSTVLNLLGLRFANRLFESVWNRDNVSAIDIIYDETLALEGRAGYYDNAGALVDMIQSHLLLVAGIMTMEAPAALDADDLRGSLVQALRAMRPLDDDPARASRRARYTAGEVDGNAVPAYAEEEGVEPERGTETLAELVVTVDNARWAGVPITLRSGKAVGQPRKDAVLTLRPVAHLPRGFRGAGEAPRISVSLTPEHLTVDLDLNGPGDPLVLERVHLDSDIGSGELTAYGEVLDGILEGDPLLSVPADAAELCWALVDPVLAAWQDGAVPLEEYPAGSNGPAAWATPLADRARG
ncbi:glucose-6-phosphate dehydrogenase [Microcella sp.]|uniref:glucose-6-phosphate dehydrogenase n=1 Tax=Microcella sp. TaxID=1913979 RepID=UPI003919CE58